MLFVATALLNIQEIGTVHIITFITTFFFWTFSFAEAMEDNASNEYYAKFYCFDVGQGNCQLVYYPEEKVAFLYDAGSASKNKHFKLLSNNKEQKPFFELNGIVDKNMQKNQTNEIDMQTKLKRVGIQHKNANLNNKQAKMQTMQMEGADDENNHKRNSNVSNDDLDATHIMNAENTISETIKKLDLELLIVFLSHPDKDHISFLKTKKNTSGGGNLTLPPNIPTIVFACGRFIHNDSADVKNFLNFVHEQEKINNNFYVVYPYTWYREDNEKFLKSISDNKDPNDVLVQGDFYTLFDSNEKLSDLNDKINEKSRETLEKLKNKVFIWGMNNRSNDENAQSTVISFKISEDVSLILTGDAEPETFKKISNVADETVVFVDGANYENMNKKRQKLSFSSNKILGTKRILLVPHHGSENNISNDMMDFFNPSLFIISAANGRQFSHPHAKVIDWLHKKFIDQIVQPVGSENNLVLFFEKENSKFFHSQNIISTNYSGTISFEDGKFFRTFSNVIDHESSSYLVDFSQSIDSFSENDKFQLLTELRQKISSEQVDKSKILHFAFSIDNKLYYVVMSNSDKDGLKKFVKKYFKDKKKLLEKDNDIKMRFFSDDGSSSMLDEKALNQTIHNNQNTFLSFKDCLYSIKNNNNDVDFKKIKIYSTTKIERKVDK